jgi:hypothetical protein
VGRPLIQLARGVSEPSAPTLKAAIWFAPPARAKRNLLSRETAMSDGPLPAPMLPVTPEASSSVSPPCWTA